MKNLHKYFLLYLLSLFFSIGICVASPPDLYATEHKGGLVIGSKILKVTSLEDSGPGTLRQALLACNTCIIVFDISGIIHLKTDLTITHDHITIAGETSPASGVILNGGSLNIRSSDVLISNISVYPGSSPNPKIAENRDGISMYGSKSKNRPLSGIILRNVSVGWGVDENIGIQGLVDGVRIEYALIAQPLRLGGHPKGVHSMNLLLANTVGRVEILGSILAGSEQRSPRLTNGNQVSFINNLIVANGAAATHLDTSKEIINPGAIDIMGNVYVASSFSNCKNSAIHIDESFFDTQPQTKVFIEDNIINNGGKPMCYKTFESDKLAHLPQNEVSQWNILFSSQVEQHVLNYAGSHPLKRNPIDKKVISEIQQRTLTTLNNEKEIGGIPLVESSLALANVPEKLKAIETSKDLQVITLWLCAKYKDATGIDSCSY